MAPQGNPPVDRSNPTLYTRWMAKEKREVGAQLNVKLTPHEADWLDKLVAAKAAQLGPFVGEVNRSTLVRGWILENGVALGLVPVAGKAGS